MKSILLLLLITVSLATFSQTYEKAISFSAGWSAFNSKSLSLACEKPIRNGNYIGVYTEILYYNNSKKLSPLKSLQKQYFGGLFYKPLIASSRNFAHYALIGAAAGSSDNKFVYYPLTGLEQIFYVSPTTRIFIREELDYLFKEDKPWQPFIKAGLKFKLN